MFSLKKLWDRWLSAEETEEESGPNSGYESRPEPPVGPDSEAPVGAPPDAAAILAAPRLMTV